MTSIHQTNLAERSRSALCSWRRGRHQNFYGKQSAQEQQSFPTQSAAKTQSERSTYNIISQPHSQEAPGAMPKCQRFAAQQLRGNRWAQAIGPGDRSDVVASKHLETICSCRWAADTAWSCLPLSACSSRNWNTNTLGSARRRVARTSGAPIQFKNSGPEGPLCVAAEPPSALLRHKRSHQTRSQEPSRLPLRLLPGGTHDKAHHILQPALAAELLLARRHLDRLAKIPAR